MKSRSIFVGGTSSNAGKSWMATAICAWLRSGACPSRRSKRRTCPTIRIPAVDGGEIGRAQVVQAEACGLEPETAMNPILLKPNGDGTSQVVVNGRVWKTLSAREYYEHFDVLQRESARRVRDSRAVRRHRHRRRGKRQRVEPRESIS